MTAPSSDFDQLMSVLRQAATQSGTTSSSAKELETERENLVKQVHELEELFQKIGEPLLERIDEINRLLKAKKRGKSHKANFKISKK